jgi:hypothetical protein
MAKFSFCDTDWVYTPNQVYTPSQGALRCVPPAPLSRLAGYALAVLRPLASGLRYERKRNTGEEIQRGDDQRP